MMQNPSQIAHALAAQRLPPNKALLGLHPALCAYLGTDSISRVRAFLLHATLDVGADMCAAISACVASDAYPHKSTVWQFNDPNTELYILRQAFNGRASESERRSALNDLVMTLDTHGDTYPYIDTDFVENELEFFCESSECPSWDAQTAAPEPIRELAAEDSAEQVQSRPNPPTQSAPAAAFWIPTLAAGSLLIASLVAKDK